EERVVQMPAAQFNAQVQALNPELSDEHLSNLYLRNADGSIPMFKGPGSTPVVLEEHQQRLTTQQQHQMITTSYSTATTATANDPAMTTVASTASSTGMDGR